MTRRTTRILTLAASAALSITALQAQGRGSVEWTTGGGDAQRSSWIRNDAKISTESLQKPGAFKFLWKLKMANEPKQLNALTQPILLDRIIGFRGFKSIAFVGSSSETIYAIDTDLGTELWRVHLNFGASFPPIVAGTLACPGGLTAAVTRPTALAIQQPAARGAAAGGGRGGRSGGGVGEPGKGATTLATAGQGRGRGAAPGLPAAPGGAPAPGSAAAVAAAARGGGGGGGRGGAVGAPDAAYVVGSDGFVRALNVQNGWELAPPVQFLPANVNAAGLILVNDATSGYLYTSTVNACGSTPDGIWAVDLIAADKNVTSWSANGATIAGSAGPALGRDGTLYVATTDGAGSLSNAVVALEPKTLKQKSVFIGPKADFATSPLVFDYKGKDVIAAAGADGRIYLLDSASMGTPLAVSTTSGGQPVGGALASWQDAQGVRWILMSAAGAIKTSARPAAGNGLVTHGAMTAFKLVDEGGALALQPGWTSRDLTSPLTPMIVNGVVFAASSGEYRTGDAKVSAAQRAQRSTPAVLYALDGGTGKELWNSGRTIGSFGRGGLSAGAGVVYIPTYDGTLYAFGVPIDK
ncbi:MAG: PQQ-binding-like beta-propeller repeat protein [Acidobacteriota bacterium]